MRYLRLGAPMFIWMLFIVPPAALAKQGVMDSLRVAVQVAKADTQRVLAICELAYEMNKTTGENPEQILLEAIGISKRIKFDKGLGLALVQLGVWAQHNGKYEAAEEYYVQALNVRKRIRDASGITSVLGNLGGLKKLQGDILGSLQFTDSALKMYASMGDSTSVSRLSSQLCILHRAMGNFRLSLLYGFRGLRIRENAPQPDSSGIGTAYMVIGSTFEHMEQNDRADSVYRIAKTCFEATGNTRELANVLNNLGVVSQYNADFEKALRYYQQSYELRIQAHDLIETVRTIRNIARIYIWTQKFEQAKIELKKAQNLLNSTDDVLQKTIIDADLAEIYLWNRQTDIAEKMLMEALPILDSIGTVSDQIYYRELLCIATASLDKWDASMYWNLDALRLRHPYDLQINASSYLYDQSIISKRNQERAEANSKLLEQDLLLQRERTRVLWIAIASLLIVIVLIISISLQRIQLLRNKRNAVEQKFQLEMKQREVERMEQSKKLEILKVTLEVEDRERSRIAHDLHDRVGAQIGAFKHLFGQLRDDFAATSPTFSQSFEKLNAELEELMVEVRAVAHDLASPTLETFGLVAALNGFRDLFAKSPGFDFELDVHGFGKRLDPKMEKQIYLILKELFSNAINRGKATAFSIQLMRMQQQLTIVVEDNGSGFDTKLTRDKPGLGLRGIHNRVQSMDGTLNIDSAIGRGTIVTIEIPLSQDLK